MRWIVACLVVALCTSAGYAKSRSDRATSFDVKLGGQTFGVYEHPRLWVSPQIIARLKEKAVTSNPMWVGLQFANSRDLQSGVHKTANSNTLFNLTVASLATGNADLLKAAKEALLSFVKKFDLSCDGSKYCGNDNIDYGSIDLIYFAASYDWLHKDLSDVERKSVRDWVFDKLIPFLRKHNYYGDPVHNLGHTKWIGEMMWSLATLGDDPRALPLADLQYKFFRDQIAPIIDVAYVGGHVYSGSGYGYNRSLNWALYGLEALSTATNMNAYGGRGWVADSILYRIHSVLPSGDSFHSDWESAEALFNQGRQTENEALVVSHLADKQVGHFGQYFLNKVFKLRPYANQGGDRVHPYYVGRWFLWYDPEAKEESYFNEPTAYVASGTGVGFTRSRWGDPQAAWASLSASKHYGDHQLHNEGSFKIWRGGEYLVVENGRCYAANAGDETPTDANILFLGDGIVQFRKVTGGIGRRGNDSISSIDPASSSNTHAWFQAHIKGAYEASYFPLSSATRTLVHLKDPKAGSTDAFVVLDRLKAEANFSRTLYFHFPMPPVVAGSSATLKMASGQQLSIQSLAPKGAALQVTAVADKTNKCLEQEEKDQPTRLTIQSPTSNTGVETFVTVFTAAKLSVTGSAPVLVTNGDGSAAGAFVQGVGVNRVVAVVQKSGENVASILRVPSIGSFELLVGGLLPNRSYEIQSSLDGGGRVVTIRTSASSATKADAAGVLKVDL